MSETTSGPLEVVWSYRYDGDKGVAYYGTKTHSFKNYTLVYDPWHTCKSGKKEQLPREWKFCPYCGVPL